MSLKRSSVGMVDWPPCSSSDRRSTVPRVVSQPNAFGSTSMTEMFCVMVTMSWIGLFCLFRSLHASIPAISTAAAISAAIFILFFIPPLQLSFLAAVDVPWVMGSLRGAHDSRRDEDQQLVV